MYSKHLEAIDGCQHFWPEHIKRPP